MALSEFELIDRFFNRDIGSENVKLGVGDDCALLIPTPDETLAVSTDTLIAGVHFLEQCAPKDIGYKALSSTISDLAAMGAKPLWFTMALTLPQPDESFLTGFSHGLFEAARQYGIELVGGDTTKGPLSISITVMGSVPAVQALKRKGAMVNDRIYVSGHPGEAYLGLQQALNNKALLEEFKSHAYLRMMRPTARIELGMALRKKASSAIDISDGLLADLSHILSASKVGAIIDVEALPFSDLLQSVPKDEALDAILRGGDDYELCFTISPLFENELKKMSTALNVPLTYIGKIVEKPGMTIYGLAEDKVAQLVSLGYKHF